MKKELDKNALVAEFFKLDRDYLTVFINRFFEKLERHSSHIDFDNDLENIRTVLRIWRAGYAKEPTSYAGYKKMAQPIFDHMRETSDWSFLDIAILCSVIRYAETIEEAVEMTDKALHILDTQYTQEEKYWNAKWVIQCNIIPRIVQARHFNKVGQNKPEADMEMLKKAMERYSAYALAVSKDYNHRDFELMTILRLAMFGGDYEEVEGVLNRIGALDMRGGKKLYKAAMNEVMPYHRVLGLGLSKQFLWRIVGRNVRIAREAVGLTINELAGKVNVNETYLAQMERAIKGFRSLDLYKISHILKVDISFFYYGESFTPEDAPNTELEDRIFAAVRGLSTSKKKALAKLLESETDN